MCACDEAGRCLSALVLLPQPSTHVTHRIFVCSFHIQPIIVCSLQEKLAACSPLIVSGERGFLSVNRLQCWTACGKNAPKCDFNHSVITPTHFGASCLQHLLGASHVDIHSVHVGVQLSSFHIIPTYSSHVLCQCINMYLSFQQMATSLQVFPEQES